MQHPEVLLDLHEANLVNADLRGANLCEANLIYALQPHLLREILP